MKKHEHCFVEIRPKGGRTLSRLCIVQFVSSRSLALSPFCFLLVLPQHVYEPLQVSKDIRIRHYSLAIYSPQNPFLLYFFFGSTCSQFQPTVRSDPTPYPSTAIYCTQKSVTNSERKKSADHITCKPTLIRALTLIRIDRGLWVQFGLLPRCTAILAETSNPGLTPTATWPLLIQGQRVLSDGGGLSEVAEVRAQRDGGQGGLCRGRRRLGQAEGRLTGSHWTGTEETRRDTYQTRMIPSPKRKGILCISISSYKLIGA